MFCVLSNDLVSVFACVGVGKATQCFTSLSLAFVEQHVF